MAVTIPELAAEINTDPQTYGYGPHVTTGNDQAIADLLNKIRTGADGEAAIVIPRSSCSGVEIQEAMDLRDISFPGTIQASAGASFLESAWQSTQVPLLTPPTQANPNGQKTLIRKNLDRITGDINGSQARLDALALRNGSRAEQLFGVGTVVTSSNVAKALRP